MSMTITQMLDHRRQQSTEPARCMLAQRYMGHNVNGWLMSEKLDGVRGCWTGTELLSRNGNKFPAPSWFTAQLPRGIALDGELWAGRGRFTKMLSIIKTHNPDDADWAAVRYCVFDAPGAQGALAQRLAFAGSTIAATQIGEIVPQRVCRDREALLQFFSSLLSLGGEGVVLRAPASAYEWRRSPNMLKLKPCE